MADFSVSRAELEGGRAAAKRLRAELQDKGLTYHIESYGCQMNDHDSEKLGGLLEACGYMRAGGKGDADLILFNTCCVREHAEKRVMGNIGALRQRKEDKPSLLIAVCGCMMQQRETAEKLFRRFPFVDLIFGTNELHLFPNLLERALNGERPFSVREMDGEIAEGLPAARGSAYCTNVTIMYGCDNFCSYCIVPYVRGRERSRAPEAILDEVRSLADQGYKEVTLLGQNVNSYSYREGEGWVDFPELLGRVNDLGGIGRIRFMTSHPKDLSPKLIGAMATLGKVCNHIHLPVQSGSDRILALMNRSYGRGHYLSLVDALREAVEGIEITTDIIVGFPGETEADFNDTLDLAERVGFANAYTFMYSSRSGTRAAAMPDQVAEATKKERLGRLNALIADGIKRGNEKYIGSSGEVLVEGCDERDGPRAFGKLRNFKMVYFPGNRDLIGTTQTVRIEAAVKNSLMGALVQPSTE